MFSKDCKKSFPSALCLGGSLAAVQRLLRGRGLFFFTLLDFFFLFFNDVDDGGGF